MMASICQSRSASGLDEAMCNESAASCSQAGSSAATGNTSFGVGVEAHPAAARQAAASKNDLNGARMF
jgi:hypothetical protein